LDHEGQTIGSTVSHINQVTCALRFFYAVTLGRKEAIERIISVREPQKQPLVLSAEEVARLLEAVPALRDRVALVTAYAAGLRVGEVMRGCRRRSATRRLRPI
jgi:site-specific recombinase XerD